MTIKNELNQYVTVNSAFMDLLELPPNYPIAGKTLDQLPTPFALLAQRLHKQETLAMTNREKISSIVTHTFGAAKTMHTLCFDACPFYDDEGYCMGTMLTVRPLDFFCPSSLLEGDVPKPLIYKKPSAFFTNAEWEVIFLITLNYNRKKISRLLNLSLKAVEHRISTCLQKTGCIRGDELVSYCRQRCWDNYVPPRFMKPRFRLFKAASGATSVDYRSLHQ